jgi:hypothetical protein
MAISGIFIYNSVGQLIVANNLMQRYKIQGIVKLNPVQFMTPIFGIPAFNQNI